MCNSGGFFFCVSGSQNAAPDQKTASASLGNLLEVQIPVAVSTLENVSQQSVSF